MKPILTKDQEIKLSEMIFGKEDQKKESKWWICSKCGHEILSSKPAPIKWTDGHVCYFVENKDSRK